MGRLIMLRKETQIKINTLSFHRLNKIANWLWKRYENKKAPEIAHYIMVHHYHWEEYMAGLL
jgi:hypothetical protein